MVNQESITVAIVDDEPAIRQLIQSHLETIPDVKVIASISTGGELLDFMKNNKLTAVFLDIEMADMDGLITARRIKKEYPDVLIVFVTAHSKYAAESYQVDAVDYLIKPVTKKSITKAINKIREFLSLHSNSNSTSTKNTEKERILIKNNHEIYFLNINEIVYIEKEYKKAVIHTLRDIYPTTDSLLGLEDKLGNSFFRCHKSFIINIDKIEKIAPISDRVYEISFDNHPQKVSMRRKKFEEHLYYE